MIWIEPLTASDRSKICLSIFPPIDHSTGYRSYDPLFPVPVLVRMLAMISRGVPSNHAQYVTVDPEGAVPVLNLLLYVAVVHPVRVVPVEPVQKI